jgi:hypothetical protein
MATFSTGSSFDRDEKPMAMILVRIASLMATGGGGIKMVLCFCGLARGRDEERTMVKDADK